MTTTHFWHASNSSGTLCGSMGGDAHTERSKVNCERCLAILAAQDTGELGNGSTRPDMVRSAEDAIAEVAELADKPPTDDTAGEDITDLDVHDLEAARLRRQFPGAADADPDADPVGDYIRELGAPMEPITSTVTRHDPAHHTERSLRVSASWQVLCQARVELNALAGQTTFQGGYPVGEVTRLCQELHRAMVKDAYAWGMHQCDMEWLVAGLDTRANYREHFEQTWGEQLAQKLAAWWQPLYDAAHARALEDHAERQRLSSYAPPAHG